jgi:hypothetical protein
MLKLINGTKKSPRFTQEQLADKHYAMGANSLVAYYNTDDRWQLRKAAYNMVRYAVYRYHTLKDVGSDFPYKTMFQMVETTKDILAMLTPKELITTFPVRKDYDGDRWECADYFSTMDKFSGMDADLPMNEQVEDMVDWLWGYQNIWLQHFLVTLFGIVSKIRQLNGEDDLLTGFFKSQGKEPPETIMVYKDAKGKSYAIDSNGKTMPLRKAKPRYLRVVK